MLLDASGNLPAPLTAFEMRLAEKTANGGMKRELAELQRKQAMPLQEKIALSQELIHDWYESWDGKVSVKCCDVKWRRYHRYRRWRAVVLIKCCWRASHDQESY